jgi:hypothetical protein
MPILTPTWLVYAAKGDSGIVSVLSVPLVEAVAEDYAQSPFYAKIQDHGFHITGAFTGRVGYAWPRSGSRSFYRWVRNAMPGILVKR